MSAEHVAAPVSRQSLSLQLRQLAVFLLTDRVALACLTVAYLTTGIVFVLTDYTLNDEGLLTYYWASWARQEFSAVFFFQRVRPVLSALYLPTTIGGLHGTLLAHVAVATAAIPMSAAVARSLGQRLPNLPALALALSPLYFYGGPAGFPNGDGVVAIVLALYLLHARRNPCLAGLVAGTFPWVRVELLVFCAALTVYGTLSRRDRPLLAGLPIFPVLYAIAGALYHHDLLWLLHYPPSAPADPSGFEWKTQLRGMQYFLEPLLALTPIGALIVALRPTRLQWPERMLLIYLVVAALLINVLPIFKMANFGTSPRYSMCLLPVLVLLIGRAVEPWWEGERPPLITLAAVLGLAFWVATRQQDPRTTVFIFVAYAVFAVAARFRFAIVATGIASLLMASGPLLWVRLEVGRNLTAPYLDAMTRWLQAHRAEVPGPIFTNSNLLSAFLESRLPGVEVRFVAGPEMTRDGGFLANASNGQLERIRHLGETNLYGHGMFRPIKPEDLTPGAVLAFREDVRISTMLPEAVWGSRLEVLEATPQYRIARLRVQPGDRSDP